jgi:hypothetical protein
MVRIGIIGHAADKFTVRSSMEAVNGVICSLLMPYRTKSGTVFISGHSPLGGVDLWAEDAAKVFGFRLDIKKPEVHQWHDDGAHKGFRSRNIDIAKSCDELHVILISDYPPDYRGMKFDDCYHCKTHSSHPPHHVKSGACWTGWKASELGKLVVWHIINLMGDVDEWSVGNNARLT